MNSKKVNWLFLCIILVDFTLLILLMVLGRLLAGKFTFGIAENLILSELCLLVPAVLFALAARSGSRKKGFHTGSFNEFLGFRKIKVSSFFMVILFTFLIMPMTTAINAISMLFVDNTVNAISGDILRMPFPVMLFLVGIYGPFCEEVVFRGIIFRGYKNSGSVFWSIIWSSLLFGLMHLNFNQAAYAIAIGIMFALLVEATGSLWSSAIAHMVFNSQQVCMMYLVDCLMPGTYTVAEGMLTQDVLLAAIGPYLVVAVISTALAVCVLVWLAKNEQRETSFRSIWTCRKEKKGYLISIPLIIAIVLSLAYMSLELIFL